MSKDHVIRHDVMVFTIDEDISSFEHSFDFHITRMVKVHIFTTDHRNKTCLCFFASFDSFDKSNDISWSVKSMDWITNANLVITRNINFLSLMFFNLN